MRARRGVRAQSGRAALAGVMVFVEGVSRNVLDTFGIHSESKLVSGNRSPNTHAEGILACEARRGALVDAGTNVDGEHWRVCPFPSRKAPGACPTHSASTSSPNSSPETAVQTHMPREFGMRGEGLGMRGHVRPQETVQSVEGMPCGMSCTVRLMGRVTIVRGQLRGARPVARCEASCEVRGQLRGKLQSGGIQHADVRIHLPGLDTDQSASRVHSSFTGAERGAAAGGASPCEGRTPCKDGTECPTGRGLHALSRARVVHE